MLIRISPSGAVNTDQISYITAPAADKTAIHFNNDRTITVNLTMDTVLSIISQYQKVGNIEQ